MGKSNTNEERELSKLIDKFPLDQEIKAVWKEQIMGSGGLTEELVEEIQKKLSGEGSEDSGPVENFVQVNTQFSAIIRRWRLAYDVRPGEGWLALPPFQTWKSQIDWLQYRSFQSRSKPGRTS